MLGEKQAEESIVPSNFNESEHGGTGGKEDEDHSALSMKNLMWHGGSVWDAWFSCSSNQVAQVLLTLPYSFSQLGMVSGIVLQIFYGLLGSWSAYLIFSGLRDYSEISEIVSKLLFQISDSSLDFHLIRV